MALLRIKLADHSEITHELSADRVTIGRRPDNLIQIIDRSVSAHHAELILEDGHYRLQDLGSTNLSFVNGNAVMTFHLREQCRIAFGTVQCEFDPVNVSNEPKVAPAQVERELGFLRGENAELKARIVTLERQIDMLGSARLVTKRADSTPQGASNETTRIIVGERDDLRHLSAGLKLELEKLRQDLDATARERDAARQALEFLQIERVTQAREQQEQRRQGPSGSGASDGAASPKPGESPTVIMNPIPQNGVATSPSSAFAHPTATFANSPGLATADTTHRVTLPPPPEIQAVAAALAPVRAGLEKIAAGDPAALPALAPAATNLANAASRLPEHPISRLTLALEALVYDVAGRDEPLAPACLQTFQQAADLIARLLEPRQLERSENLLVPRVLAVDDDAELLNSLAASLELAQLSTTTCPDSRDAAAFLERDDFDLLLLDADQPGFDGPALCSRIREMEHHRTTPVIFLTVPNGAPPSLNGGNDFLPKPFNTAELTVKAETWIWKSRFGLL